MRTVSGKSMREAWRDCCDCIHGPETLTQRCRICFDDPAHPYWYANREPTVPACPKCGKSDHMVQHGDEWVCHNTHVMTSDIRNWPNVQELQRELAVLTAERDLLKKQIKALTIALETHDACVKSEMDDLRAELAQSKQMANSDAIRTLNAIATHLFRSDTNHTVDAATAIAAIRCEWDNYSNRYRAAQGTCNARRSPA